MLRVLVRFFKSPHLLHADELFSCLELFVGISSVCPLLSSMYGYSDVTLMAHLIQTRRNQIEGLIVSRVSWGRLQQRNQMHVKHFGKEWA